MNKKDIFPTLKKEKDKKYPFVDTYEYKGHYFYIEPIYKVQFNRVSERFPSEVETLKNLMLERVSTYGTVVFTGDFTSPLVDEEEFTYVEIDDLLCELNLPIEDKSRGSDYGD
ncbi:MAG: hypothetical protein ACOX28_02800 [Bacilli bacterium]|jgi:hypothetical protein